LGSADKLGAFVVAFVAGNEQAFSAEAERLELGLETVHGKEHRGIEDGPVFCSLHDDGHDGDAGKIVVEVFRRFPDSGIFPERFYRVRFERDEGNSNGCDRYNKDAKAEDEAGLPGSQPSDGIQKIDECAAVPAFNRFARRFCEEKEQGRRKGDGEKKRKENSERRKEPVYPQRAYRRHGKRCEADHGRECGKENGNRHVFEGRDDRFLFIVDCRKVLVIPVDHVDCIGRTHRYEDDGQYHRRHRDGLSRPAHESHRHDRGHDDIDKRKDDSAQRPEAEKQNEDDEDDDHREEHAEIADHQFSDDARNRFRS